MEEKNIEEVAKKIRREYYRQYYATHKEQKAAANRKYWAKRAAKLVEQRKVENDESND